MSLAEFTQAMKESAYAGAGIFLPATWCALDIETGGGRPDMAEAWMRRNWSPSPAWKPATIGDRYMEMLEKKKAALALIDESSIVAISLRTMAGLWLFHTLPDPEPKPIEGVTIYGCDGQRGLLAAWRQWTAERCDDQTVLVGHNIRAFDLPRLRSAFLQEQLALPLILSNGDQPTFDTMREYCRRFSADSDAKAMIGLVDVLERMGMTNHKKDIDGSDVGGLLEAKQHDVIARYAVLDVMAESEVFLRMCGMSTQLA